MVRDRPLNSNGLPIYSSPQPAENSSILAQGRYTNTYALQDNAAWTHGHHSVKFGFQYQGVTVRTYDFSGTIPSYNLGTTSSLQGGNLLGTSELPGIGTLDLENANALLASLAALPDNANVTYNVTSRTSGFVPGAPYLRNFIYDNHAFYGQDEWRLRKNLTFTAALRWDLLLAGERARFARASASSGQWECTGDAGLKRHAQLHW